MKAPMMLGRSKFGSRDHEEPRAITSPGPMMSVPYVSGACGTVTVQVFHSEDDEDRGGIVLRISVENADCSFFPTAVMTPNGVELHMAGDAEAASLVRALRGILVGLPESHRYKGISEYLMADYGIEPNPD